MAKIFEEIVKLHTGALYNDLKIVISLVLSRHASSVSNPSGCSIVNFTNQHLYQLNIFYADAWFVSGEYRKAEKYYKEAVGIRRSFRRPNDTAERSMTVELTSETELKYKLYKVYMELKQIKLAIQTLEGVHAKDRTLAINMALGDLYRDEGMDRSAITSYKEVLRICPLSVKAATNLLMFGVQRLNIATLMLSTLQAINGEDWLIEWINLQQHIIEKNRLSSLNRIQVLERLCPRNVEVMNTKADIHFMNGQYSQAKIIWEEVVDADPFIMRNAEKMAYVQMTARDHQGLAKLCTHFTNANPSLPEPWIVNGAYCISAAKYADAICMAQKALLLRPKFCAAYILKGVALSLSERPLDSEQTLKEAIRLYPCRLEAYKELLNCYMRIPKIKEAIALANTAIRQIGTTPVTLYMCGRALARGSFNQMLKAKWYLEKAIQTDPTYVFPVYVLVNILNHQEKYTKAMHVLENALKTNSTSKLHQLYGDAMFEIGNRQKAMSHYGIALHLDPANKLAKEGMESAEKKSETSVMDDSYMDNSLEQSSEVEMNEEGGDNLSWSDPELGY